MVNLKDLKQFLIGKRNFLVRLLENPALLEHESFTGLLRAVFHLTEELEFRKDLDSLPDSDYGHIRVDLERVYVRLFEAWLDYMKYMKNHHPYLYSLAMRTNPFDATPSVLNDHSSVPSGNPVLIAPRFPIPFLNPSCVKSARPCSLRTSGRYSIR